ncbi:hypothetical protein WR25_21011 [Diploscapter pachys]|uniref:Uncharacterized protein n=1 Tax=Diploscapter pachys TaxID=2018661 RepID=A0A2A2KFZ7_9BILA|nr:hypothetical protein WR25_21011 [Diploscapter pachys]
MMNRMCRAERLSATSRQRFQLPIRPRLAGLRTTCRWRRAAVASCKTVAVWSVEALSTTMIGMTASSGIDRSEAARPSGLLKTGIRMCSITVILADRERAMTAAEMQKDWSRRHRRSHAPRHRWPRNRAFARVRLLAVP